MITVLEELFLSLGVKGPFVKFLSWAVAIIGAVLIVWGGWALWLHFHDKGVIDRHEQQISNQANTEVTAGKAKADAADNAQAAQDAARANQVQEDIGNAVVAHPKEAHASTGPVSQSALDRLRHRPR